jgi:hypothetical protein
VTKVKEAKRLLDKAPNASAEALISAVLSHAVGFSGDLAEALKLNEQSLKVEQQIDPGDRQLLGFNPKYWLWALRARMLLTCDKINEAEVYLDLLLNNTSESVDILHKAIALGIQIEKASLIQNNLLAEETATALRTLLKENRTPYLTALGDHFRALSLITTGRMEEALLVLSNLLSFVRESRAGLEYEPYILAHFGEALATTSPNEAYSRLDEGRRLARSRCMRVAEAYLLSSLIRTGRRLGNNVPNDAIKEFRSLVDMTGAVVLNRRLFDQDLS